MTEQRTVRVLFAGVECNALVVSEGFCRMTVECDTEAIPPRGIVVRVVEPDYKPTLPHHLNISWTIQFTDGKTMGLIC